MTVSKEQNEEPVGQRDATNGASERDALRVEVQRLDRLIAVGLTYLGDGSDVGVAAQDDASSGLHADIARRKQLVAALEELEARRQEVRELRQQLGVTARAEATATVGWLPPPLARWAQAAWMRTLITYGVPAVYLIAMVLGEALIALGAAPGGMLLGLALLAILPLHATFAGRRQAALLTAFTLLPLIRVVSLALPLSGFTLAGAYLLTGIPVLLGAGATIWVLGLSPGAVGLRVGRPLVQVGIGLLGIPLGIVQYGVLGPRPMTAGGPALLVLSALILLVFVAFAEELVYRGILQTTATAALGRVGVLYTSAAFAAGYIGNGSVLSVVLAFGSGLLFALLAARTGSIVGVSVAHGLALVLSLLVWPLVVATTL